jgi:hypothetical protein
MFDAQQWITLLTGAGLGTTIAIVLLNQFLKERNSANEQIVKDRDEDRQRISALEKFQQDTLLTLIKDASVNQQRTNDLIKETHTIFKESTDAIKENIIVTQKCIATLSLLEKK